MWTLPWPPTLTNRMYRVSRAHVHMAPEARDWKMAAALVVKANRDGLDLGERNRLALTILAHPPKGFHGDTDGLIKLTMDALFLGLGINDYWVAELHTFRGPTCVEPHIDVILEPCRWRSLDEVRTNA